MKKLLEAELISIAHRILKLKGREDLEALLKESQLVTQKLSVLKFYEDYKYMIQNDMPQEDFDKQLMDFSFETQVEIVPNNAQSDELVHENIETTIEIKDNDEQEVHADVLTEITIEEPVVSTSEEWEIQQEKLEELPVDLNAENQEVMGIEQLAENNIVESEVDLEEEESLEEAENIEENIIDEPESENTNDIQQENISKDEKTDELLIAFDSEVEEKQQETPKAIERKLEDLFKDFTDFDFVKAEGVGHKTKEQEIKKEIITEDKSQISETKTNDQSISFDVTVEKKTIETIEKKVFSINDKLTGGVKIGLNDKIGFVKHLFDGSDEDFTRVISQLNTFSSHQDALDFIENVVKPDYNNWEDKDDYANRFFGILERSY
jgi:hypothetical protein